MKKLFSLVLLLACAAILLAGCSNSQKGITVASKQYTEQILLSEIYAQLIEAKTDIPVTRKLNLGGTSVVFSALKNGEVDLYFEYTGTAYNEILKHELITGMTHEEVLQISQEEFYRDHDITMFDSVGFNNTYALAIKTSRMDEFGISTVSELAPLTPKLRFAAGHAFYTRLHDGYDALVETYGVAFKETLKMDTTLLYEGADKGELDVIIVFSTDGLLKKYQMTVLEDDKGVFPPYNGAPVIRNDTLEQYPELAEVLNVLSGKIDDETLQELNYQVDVGNRAVEDVARDFLTQNGYL